MSSADERGSASPDPHERIETLRTAGVSGQPPPATAPIALAMRPPNAAGSLDIWGHINAYMGERAAAASPP